MMKPSMMKPSKKATKRPNKKPSTTTTTKSTTSKLEINIDAKNGKVTHSGSGYTVTKNTKNGKKKQTVCKFVFFD
jgi:hypothetical protein